MNFESGDIIQVSLNDCLYDREKRVLVVPSTHTGRKLPRRLKVFSKYTGEVVEFASISSHDPLYDEDGWDGEQQIYRPVSWLATVDHLIVYHQ